MFKNAPIVAVLPAANINETKKFYQDKLELQAIDAPTPGKDVYFKAGKETYLYLYERKAGTKADHTVASIIVDDIEKAVEDLQGKGVAFEKYDAPGLKTDEHGIADLERGSKAAWFKDPEGNILALTEPPVPLS